MIATVERAIGGVVLLFRGRAEGLALMDRSISGFWRSFLFTLLLVLPLDAIATLASMRLGAEAPFAVLFAGRVPALLLDFALFPLLLAAAAKPLGISRTYVDYVVARNWGTLVAFGLLIVPIVLEGAGWLGEGTSQFLSLVLIVLVLRYQWMTLRLALKVDVSLAVLLVGVDIMISLVLTALFNAA